MLEEFIFKVFSSAPSRRLSLPVWFAIGAVVIQGCASNLEVTPLASKSEPVSAAAERTYVSLEDAHGRKLATASVAPVPAPAAGSSEFDVVTVMWGTNRETVANANGETASATTSAPEFTDQRSPLLTTGYSKITIPKKGRAVGEIPLAGGEYTILNVTVYSDKEDPREHFTIGESRALTKNEFTARANGLQSRAKSFEGHAFVYVHGYWNTFNDSLYRTAQLAYDMGFDGVPYSFSWPSKGTALGYLNDRDSVDASQQQFYEFLRLVSETSRAKHIHIIGHSMGARLIVDTLFPPVGGNRLAEFPKLNQIVLAAADVDQRVMRARAAAVGSGMKSVTLYASDKDEALIASKRLAASDQRIGEVRDGRPFIMKGVETIDISSAGTLVFFGKNHNKYATSRHILTDIATLMKTGVHPPDVRFPIFAAANATDGKYWRYVKE